MSKLFPTPVVFYALFFGLLVIAGVGLVPFVSALLWALVFSVLTYPWYVRLLARFQGLNRFRPGIAETVASLTTLALTTIVVVVPFLLIGFAIAVQLQDLVDTHFSNGGAAGLEQMLREAEKSFAPLRAMLGAEKFSLADYVMTNKTEIIAQIRPLAAKGAQQAGVNIVTFLLALLTQYYMLVDGHKLRAPVLDLSPLSREKTDALLVRLKETTWAVFHGSVLVAMIQGALIGVAYAWAKVPGAMLLGVVSAFLSLIPVLGAPVLYIPIGLLLIAQGNYSSAAIVLGVGMLVVSNIDNVLKPLLIRDRASLHAVGILFSIIGGAVVFGTVGVMVGPMVLTLLVVFADEIREKMAARKDAEEETAAQSVGVASIDGNDIGDMGSTGKDGGGAGVGELR